LLLGWWKKLSVSGAREPLPSSFMRWKIGVSLSLSRMWTEKISRITETMNGMRQPQSAKSFGSMYSLHSAMTIKASSRPSVAVVWIQLVAKPRSVGRACSAT
jgi:hypothetical protein